MILVSKDNQEQINEELNNDNIFIVSDDNLEKLYPNLFTSDKKFIIKAGEASKNLKTVEEVCSKMLEVGCNRATTVIAIGGGVVGDLAGFVAAIFMRGVKWINIPTTLLAQVDSSIGGKTGVDFKTYKNMLGAFYQPEKIIISAHFLDTLPERELLCGMGEVIKTAFLEPEIFNYFCEDTDKLLSYDKDSLFEVIEMCVDYKEWIVLEDEKETKGLRSILNLGHTIGHALESFEHYKKSHGEYVLHGLRLENFMCKNFINPDTYELMQEILKRALGSSKIQIDAKKIAKLTVNDKKNKDGKIMIVCAIDKGEQSEMFFTLEQIEEGLEKCKQEFNL